MLSTPSGVDQPTVFGPTPPTLGSYSFYQVVEGDRMDTLAWRFFSNVNYWWKLADANPEVFYPETLTPGSILRIPAS
jgi:hypothetical protein